MSEYMRMKMEEFMKEFEQAAADLRKDGLYCCCASTYEHCAGRIQQFLQDTAS